MVFAQRFPLLQSVSYLLGGSAIALAIALGIWSADPSTIFDWALGVLGPGFVGLLAMLLLASLYCLIRVWEAEATEEEAAFWLSAGLQSANGVATLALTYTLFGISVGIGALADQGLTPETVEGVIRDLTASFALAFMTTVIGLPLSAFMRSALVITHGRRALRSAPKADLILERSEYDEISSI